MIGKKLSKTLRSKSTAEGAIDQWRLQHIALQEMNEKYPFFIPMCIVIGQQKVRDAVWVSDYLSVFFDYLTVFFLRRPEYYI